MNGFANLSVFASSMTSMTPDSSHSAWLWARSFTGEPQGLVSNEQSCGQRTSNASCRRLKPSLGTRHLVFELFRIASLKMLEGAFSMKCIWEEPEAMAKVARRDRRGAVLRQHHRRKAAWLPWLRNDVYMHNN